MRFLACIVMLIAWPLHAADVDRLRRQIDRGSTTERTAALRELGKEDPAAVSATDVPWLEPGVESDADQYVRNDAKVTREAVAR